MPVTLGFLATGVMAGIASGLFGVGGGLVIIPALVLYFGMPQKTASGMSLVALLAPVGILGVWEYYRSGQISGANIKAGALIACGIFLGTFFGSKLALGAPAPLLRRGFSLFLVWAALRLWTIPN